MRVTASLQEKNGMYHAVLNYKDENNKRKQKWVSTGLQVKGNKRLAQEKLEEIKNNFILNLKATADIETDNDLSNKLFEIYMRDWLESMKGNIEEDTYDSYNTVVKKIKEYFEPLKIKLKDLKPIHIQNYYTSLFERGLSPNTVLHYHANIRKALQTAVRLELIPNNPADKVEKPKKEKFIGKFYSNAELNQLFEAIKGDVSEVIILLTSFYGLRRSEVVGLKWSAFNFEENTFSIKHKVIETVVDNERTILLKDTVKNNSSFRTLPLVPEIKEVLLKHKENVDKNRKICKNSYNTKYLDYIAVNAIGKIIRPDYVTKHFGDILKSNDLRKIRFHDLRHSCASLLLARGVSMKEIQEWLGHSNYGTTANLYAHLEKDSKKKLANVLSNTLEIDKKKETFESDSNVSKIS